MTTIDTWSWWRVFSSSYKSYKWHFLLKRKQKLNSHHVVNCLLELRKICPAPFISHRYTVLICNSYDFEDTKLYPVLVTHNTFTFTFTGLLWRAVKQHQLTEKLLWRGFHNSEPIYRPTRISIPILPLFRDESLYWWSWWVRVLGDKYECR